jgi:hypothetical protein
MDFIAPRISGAAQRFLNIMECEIVDGVPNVCTVSYETADNTGYIALSTFISGSQATPELIFVMLEHFSGRVPDDEFEQLRWGTREIQQKASRLLYPEDKLMMWGVTEGEKWVDRSLRVVSDPNFNQKMFDKNGNLRLKNVFVHANYQYIYHCTLDVLEFLYNNYEEDQTT